MISINYSVCLSKNQLNDVTDNPFMSSSKKYLDYMDFQGLIVWDKKTKDLVLEYFRNAISNISSIVVPICTIFFSYHRMYHEYC